MRRIFKEYSAAKEIQLFLQAEFEEKEKELKKLKEKIKEREKEWEETTDKEQKQKLEEEIKKRKTEYERLSQLYYAELTEKEEKMAKEIKKEITRTIKEMGQEEGYCLILDEDAAGIIYGGMEFNLTDKVLQKLNEAREEEEE
jgi:Skp family chaperone for outer membrane proteins